MLHEEEALRKWAEFNRQSWNCQVELKTFNAPGTEAYCQSLFFLDRRGRLFLPPMNNYHPVIFKPTPTNKAHLLTKQWHKVAEVMLQEMSAIGCPVDFKLPPIIQDVRPWQWSNFITDVHYTYQVQFPYHQERLEGNIRRRIHKAKEAGYVVRIADKMSDVYECLLETESRKGFSHRLKLSDLERGRQLLGDEIFRPYVCYSKDGEPVSASVELILDKRCAAGLVLGTKKAHLSHGVTQLLNDFVFKDLTDLGVESFDLCGANIPSVAESKSQWGAELVPYYTVRKRSFKDLLREGKKWMSSFALLLGVIVIGGICAAADQVTPDALAGTTIYL